MFVIGNLVQPETLVEAYNTLVMRKSNTLLGGCAFLKMGSKVIGTGIDLTKLNLNYIKEDEEYIEVGATTTFREIETNSVINSYFGGVLGGSVKNIIGVQFRNSVTVGASVFSKYGFSDFITALLALDTEVELYNSGRMSLEEFLSRPYEKDILTKIFIKKDLRQAAYKYLRNSISDYSILNVTVSRLDNQWRIVVGARPMCAQVATKASKILNKECITEEDIEMASKMVSEELTFGSNMRASGEYRRAISKVLVKRAVMEVLQCK
jgi:CO/xanthine dehydrogenase FAD-binding subunit